MEYKEELYEFKSGLKLVFTKARDRYTSKVQVMFAAGAEDEKVPCGIAHLVEHSVFKGTSKYSQEDIAIMFDKLSADPSATTSSEFTTYKVAFPKPNLEKVVGLLSEMLFDSTFNQAEVDKEKLVIIEEIKMRSDMPDTLAYDNLTKTMYKGLGIGNDIAGEINLLKKVKSEDMHAFVNSHYIAPNALVSVVGDYDLKEVVAIVEKYINSKLKTSGEVKKWSDAHKITKGEVKEIKPTAQSNIIVAYGGLPHENLDRVKFNVIAYILGGSMSSRLFTKIRNELSLCYSVYTFEMTYKYNGFMGIALATSPENAIKALNAAREEVNKILISGVTDDEFNSAKEMSINAYLMQQDNPSTNLIYTAYTGKILESKKLEQTLKSMTKKECEDIFRAFVKKEEFYLSYVGKKVKL